MDPVGTKESCEGSRSGKDLIKEKDWSTVVYRIFDCKWEKNQMGKSLTATFQRHIQARDFSEFSSHIFGILISYVSL